MAREALCLREGLIAGVVQRSLCALTRAPAIYMQYTSPFSHPEAALSKTLLPFC